MAKKQTTGTNAAAESTAEKKKKASAAGSRGQTQRGGRTPARKISKSKADDAQRAVDMPKKVRVKATAAEGASDKNRTKLRVMMLGGLNEIGKNLAVIEYGDSIIIIDCGIAFPDEDMPGIDLVIPDFTYLEKNYDNIRG